MKPVLLVTGPTASGKSALAHERALRTGAEIISADSRQVYRRLDIGTAKPSPAMLREVRYHFIDEKEVTRPWSAGDFAAEAWRRIEAIESRGNEAIVVGGSTLYVEALVKGIALLPAADPALRQRLMQELRQQGGEALYRRLQALDPEQARTLDATKSQRLIRSLEIIELTGRTVTELQQQKQRPERGFELVGIDLPRPELYGRIDLRVHTMMHEGLLQEARTLWNQYRDAILARTLPALLTVGYQELFDHFEGRYGLDDAVALIQQHTRNYAKRQLTFFRNRMEVHWISPGTSI